MIALLAPRRLRLAADHRQRFGAIGLVTHVTDVRRSFPRIESYRVAHHQLARPTTAREAYDQFHGNCVLSLALRRSRAEQALRAALWN